MAKSKEKIMEIVFLLAACVSILAVALICVFLFANGIPAMKKIGFADFLLGTTWKPGNDIIGVPIGLLTAVFLAWYCPEKIYKVVKPAVELLAGIPSVVYGFFGMVMIVPAIRYNFGGTGSSILAASILLGIMILPTIIGVSESAIRAVPGSYYEGSLALGATHERSVFRAVLPAAKSGIFAGIILGVGRAIGETMAVIMVAGNQARVPKGILKGVRTLTANIVMEMGYAEGLHREALIATGVVLFVFILIINLAFSIIKMRSEKE